MIARQVNEAISNLFEKEEFKVTFGEVASDVDVTAKFKQLKFLIESRGNQALIHYGTDKVFDSSQISVHLAEQIEQIMRFQLIQD